MSTTGSKKTLYLVSVTKFTNLSGNQVSLVFLHVDGVNVILLEKEERKFNSPREIKKPTHTDRRKERRRDEIPLLSSPSFSSVAVNLHPVTAR